MRVLKKLIICLVIVVGLIVVASTSVYIAVRVNLGIDLFRTVGQLNTLRQTVNEEKSFPKAYKNSNIADLKSNLDSKIGSVLVYEEGKGYEGYSVDFSTLALSSSTAKPIILSEQEVGALAEIVFYQGTNGTLMIEDKDIPTSILQIAFTDIEKETGNANLNVTVKVDITSFKNEMKSFPLNMFKGIVPNTLYVTSTVYIEKGIGLSYTVSPKYLTLNNLSSDDTLDFFHTLDVILKIGTAEDLNLKIGTTAANALIGTEQNPGFVYTLKAMSGSGSFAFVSFESEEKQINAFTF